MPKYIDTEELNMYDDLFMKGKNDSGVWVRYKDVENLIRNAPTADVEKITRCKDCKYFIFDGFDHVCTFHYHNNKTAENDFCSHAEPRKENGK